MELSDSESTNGICDYCGEPIERCACEIHCGDCEDLMPEGISTFQIKITAQSADSLLTKAIARTFPPIISTETLPIQGIAGGIWDVLNMEKLDTIN